MNKHAPPTDDIRLIPLDQLVLSRHNSRQDVDAAEIEAMAESIVVSGLLQNLIGHAAEDGTIGIVGGGKRLRALKLLKGERGTRYFDAAPIQFDAIPVKVTDDLHRAIAWAGTENTARSALHPADEVRAYSAMRDRGSSTSMIARAFAKSEAHVERRLKLAELPPEVLTALRANEITIEAARALTLAQSPEICLATFASIRGRDVHPGRIRSELTSGGIQSTDRRAAYVGMVRYTAEGGKSNRDLFEGHSYLQDEKLLDKLFLEKAKADTEALRVAGEWKWAQFVNEPYVDYTVTKDLDRVYRTQGEITEADTEEYDRLSEIGEDALDEAGAARLRELDDRIEGDYSDDDRASGGIITYVDRRGTLTFDHAYRRKEDRPAAGGSDGTGDDTAGRIGTSTAEAKGLPQNLVDDLRAIRLASLQTALLDQSELMLDLLAYTLSGTTSPYANPLNISTSPNTNTPSRPEGTMIDARLTPEATHGQPSADPDHFAAFRKIGKKHRNTVLTEVLARSFRQPANVSAGLYDLANTLAAHVGADVRCIWTPTAAGFLGRVGGGYLDALWRDLVPAADVDPDHATFTGLKKAEKAKRLEALFSDMSVREAMGLTRDQNRRIDTWLPDELAWPHLVQEGGDA